MLDACFARENAAMQEIPLFDGPVMRQLLLVLFNLAPHFGAQIDFAQYGIGAQYEGDMFVGSATPQLSGGFLFRLKLTADRKDLALSDPLLADRAADNLDKYDITESESLLFGSNFGGVTEIQTGPNGNLYVVSVTRGAIYEIAPR